MAEPPEWMAGSRDAPVRPVNVKLLPPPAVVNTPDRLGGRQGFGAQFPLGWLDLPFTADWTPSPVGTWVQVRSVDAGRARHGKDQ
jgi:hypothetical protein